MHAMCFPSIGQIYAVGGAECSHFKRSREEGDGESGARQTDQQCPLPTDPALQTVMQWNTELRSKTSQAPSFPPPFVSPPIDFTNTPSTTNVTVPDTQLIQGYTRIAARVSTRTAKTFYFGCYSSSTIRDLFILQQVLYHRSQINGLQD